MLLIVVLTYWPPLKYMTFVNYSFRICRRPNPLCTDHKWVVINNSEHTVVINPMISLTWEDETDSTCGVRYTLPLLFSDISRIPFSRLDWGDTSYCSIGRIFWGRRVTSDRSVGTTVWGRRDMGTSLSALIVEDRSANEPSLFWRSKPPSGEADFW